jgi:hypothetical protein
MFFFKSRKRKAEAQKFLAQMANQWTMDRLRQRDERRTEQRAALNFGVWVMPMAEAGPEISQAFVAPTRDLSSNGLSLITNWPIPTPEFLVCFSGELEMRFLRAKVLCRKGLGLGWLQLSMEVIGMVKQDEYLPLQEFAESVMFRCLENLSWFVMGREKPSM